MFDAYPQTRGCWPASGHRIHRRRVVIISRQVPKPPSVTLLILGLHISGLQAVNRLHHCHSIAVVAPDPPPDHFSPSSEGQARLHDVKSRTGTVSPSM